MDNQISIKQLRKQINALLDRVELELDIESIQILDADDFYWEIALDDSVFRGAEPPTLGVGRLSDDVVFLEKLNFDENPPIIMLMHVAPILRYLAQRIRQ